MEKSVGNLSLTEKVGQMVLVGINENTSSKLIQELIQTYKIGGVVLCDNNIASVQKFIEIINDVKIMNSANQVPLFIGVAQEGGRVHALPQEIIKLPAIKYIAEHQDKNLIYETASVVGKTLKTLGVNMNFWPLLDLGGSVEGRALEDRCISNNPTLVTSYSEQIINAMHDQKIIAVPKYFPGHSTTKDKNSEDVIPYTKKSILKLEELDLAVFRDIIERGIDTMLVGHINVSRLNVFAPATLSHKVITRLLQGRYKYEGVIIVDDLTNQAINLQYGTKKAARKAILSGADLMIIKDTKKVRGVLEDIAKQIRIENLNVQAIDLRVQKILDLKDKYNVTDEEIKDVDVEKINEEMTNLLNKIRK